MDATVQLFDGRLTGGLIAGLQIRQGDQDLHGFAHLGIDFLFQ
jgi:hypothetical protein